MPRAKAAARSTDGGRFLQPPGRLHRLAAVSMHTSALLLLTFGLAMPAVWGSTLSGPGDEQLARWINDVSLAHRDCERALFLADRDSDMRRSQARSIQRVNHWFIQFEQRRIDQLVRQVNDADGESTALRQLASRWDALLDCEAELKTRLSG